MTIPSAHPPLLGLNPLPPSSSTTLSYLTMFYLNCTNLSSSSSLALSREISRLNPDVVILVESGPANHIKPRLELLGYVVRSSVTRFGTIIALRSSLPLTILPSYFQHDIRDDRLLVVTCKADLSEHLITFAAIYSHSGGDFLPASSPTRLERSLLAADVSRLAAKTRLDLNHEFILAGDFNSTINFYSRWSFQDNRVKYSGHQPKAKLDPKVPLEAAILKGLKFLSHPPSLPSLSRHTYCHNGSYSILDHILFSQGLQGGDDLHVFDPPAEVRSNHRILLGSVFMGWDGSYKSLQGIYSTSPRWKNPHPSRLNDLVQEASLHTSYFSDAWRILILEDADKAMKDFSRLLATLTAKHLGYTIRGADPLARRISKLQQHRRAIGEEISSCFCGSSPSLPLPPPPKFLPHSLKITSLSPQERITPQYLADLKVADKSLLQKINSLQNSRCLKTKSDYLTIRQALEPGDSSRDVSVLKVDHGFITDPFEVKETLRKHIHNTFNGPTPPCASDADMSHAPPYIKHLLQSPTNEEIWAHFLDPFTNQDVQSCISSSPPDKAPGPFGLHLGLLKKLISVEKHGDA